MSSYVLLVVFLSCWPVGLKWMGQEEITVFFSFTVSTGSLLQSDAED